MIRARILYSPCPSYIIPCLKSADSETDANALQNPV